MKTRMVEERIGENVGPIDWTYDFRQHFNNYCMSAEKQDELCEQRLAELRKVEAVLKEGKKASVWTSGNFQHDVIDIGMYDGWPFWKPTPSLFLSGPLGGEWTPFYNLMGLAVNS